MPETVNRRTRPRHAKSPTARPWVFVAAILLLIGIAAFFYMQRSTQQGYDAGRRAQESAPKGNWQFFPESEPTPMMPQDVDDWDLAHAKAVRFMEPYRDLPFSEVAGRYGDSGVGVAWLCTRTGLATNQLLQQTIEDCFFWSLAGRMHSPYFPDFPDEATRRAAIRAGIDEMIRRQGWNTSR